MVLRMKFPVIFVLIVLLLSMNAYAITSVTQNQITIAASKETYFCEPILSSDGCLIKTHLTIENNRVATINPFLIFDSNQVAAIRTYAYDNTNIQQNKAKGKNIRSSGNVQIKANEIQDVYIDFYAKESGKFNFSIEWGAFTVKLDPFFNVTINASSPSLHLINGENNTIACSVG